ncbi:ParB/RepB/Spo0J family partition protein [Poseidonibacter ostreae]|uniref:ParB-like N-terminal domain-containing protein n=1 Tax=Poseidonibacter ostreae TaxID=2654171 RepID=A0A6L4WWX3_9BACT|nr:ParB N-terminal domain-containing protein [Poseidonibacter ostreae]KAB7891345.1 hypothetical protein GBG19_00480 [Poseidonibacter ostreae]
MMNEEKLKDLEKLGIVPLANELKSYSIEELQEMLELVEKGKYKKTLKSGVVGRLNSLRNQKSVLNVEPIEAVAPTSTPIVLEKTLDADIIKDNPHQVRVDLKEESVISMMDSIRKDGLHTPVKVFLNEEDKEYYLVSGQIRLTAYRRLKNEDNEKYSLIPISLSEKEVYTELDFTREALIENAIRNEMTTIDFAISLKKVYDMELEKDKDLTLAIFAKEIGISRAKVGRLINIGEMLEKDIEYMELLKSLDIQGERIILAVGKLQGYTLKEKSRILEDNKNGLLSVAKIEALKNKEVEEEVIKVASKSKSASYSKKVSSLGSLFKKYKYEDFSEVGRKKIDEQIKKIEAIEDEMKTLIKDEIEEL